MKNMKRALSLVLAMVMMLGMLTIPTGAAGNFTDEDQILNSEAVAITHGMGLFAGYPDGSFNPKGTVTRAQMAVIIVKMLYGSDFDANSLRGTSKFPDVSNFEGGWAEGWINACSQLGVVAGYEDGTFRPGKEVNTAEAVTMIINALKVNPGEGTWPDNYLTKAEEMKLYGDMKVRPGMREALCRDQLAVLAFEGLWYSPEGKAGYIVPGMSHVFEDFSDAMRANGNSAIGITEAMADDSLATEVFGLKVSEGYLTANQATGETLTTIEGVDYNIETGLDLIGHYVTVYYKDAYKSDDEPGTVYTVIDETTVFTVDEAIDSSKEYKAVFGTKNYALADSVMYYDNAYELVEGTTTVAGYVAGTDAVCGTYLVYDGKIVAFIEPAEQYASYVVDVNNISGQESILISGANSGAYIPNNEDDDKIVEYKGIKSGDFVTYRQVHDVFTVTKVNSTSGALSRIDYTEIDGVENVPVLTIGGTKYTQFTGTSYVKGKLDSKVSEMSFGQNYTVYVTADNRFIGFEASDSAASADMVYLLGAISVGTKDSYGKSIVTVSARGVDMNGKEVLYPISKVEDTNGNKIYDEGETYVGTNPATGVPAGFYTIENSSNSEAKKEGLKVAKAIPTYDDGGMFQLSLNTAKAGFYGSGELKTDDTAPTFAKAGTGTKYLFIDGDVNSSTPLTAAVETTVFVALPVGTHMLVSRLPDGASNQAEMIVVLQSATDATNGVSVFVTEEQLEEASRTEDGFQITAYNAKTAEDMALVVETMDSLVEGFYSAKADEDGIHTLTPIAVDAKLGTASDILNGNTNDDVLHMNRGYHGSAKGSVIFMAHADDGAYKQLLYADAKVVDIRTDEEVEASGVARLDSVSQLISLKQSNPGLIVVGHIYGYVSNTSTCASVIYVTKALSSSPDFEGVVYSKNGPGTSGTLTMQAVDSPARDAGDVLQVTFDYCATPDQPGFYTYNVNAQGQLTLTFSNPSATLGLHNLIDAIDENGVVYASDYGSCTCGGCTGTEAFEFTITDSTLIYDKDGSLMTVDELRELAEASFATVNYSCDGAGNALVVFVYDNGLSEFASDAGVIYVSGGTGFTQGNKAAFKGYYADGNDPADEKDFMLKATATITPAVDAPGAGSFYERDAEGNMALLTVDSGKVAYHNFFLGYEDGTLTVTTETESFHTMDEHAGLDCTGEDEAVLVVSGVPTDLPVIGIAGIDTIAELQAWVEANPEKMPPLVSYYMKDGEVTALYGKSSGAFEHDLVKNDVFYVGKLPTAGSANNTTAGYNSEAYIVHGAWAGKKFTLNYGGYRTTAATNEKTASTGYFVYGNEAGGVVKMRVGAYTAYASLPVKPIIHNIFEKVEGGMLYTSQTNTGKFSGKLSERHDSGTPANNTCKLYCSYAGLEPTSMDVSGRVTVYDLRSAEAKAALPITASLAGLQEAYDNDIAVYINTCADSVVGNPRVIFIVDAEQVEF